ncbi:unnamed protein product [Cyprideis torosa]|uniref:Uncharacterized protein n=1 Tax=Cyprideis torosa TaxID=163714 RepID=A0A7R8ZRH6_9CRUS|nr:unnamed protein product [Cyprideis torosa]CAG0903750.1 unnamed protein product [Cyprideis torosa]
MQTLTSNVLSSSAKDKKCKKFPLELRKASAAILKAFLTFKTIHPSLYLQGGERRIEPTVFLFILFFSFRDVKRWLSFLWIEELVRQESRTAEFKRSVATVMAPEIRSGQHVMFGQDIKVHCPGLLRPFFFVFLASRFPP